MQIIVIKSSYKRRYIKKVAISILVNSFSIHTIFFIDSILANPCSVKCSFSFINDATLEKSEKSCDLTPKRGYFKKKGIIFRFISENFATQ